jgi:peptidoglycan hydrolase-like protein with peptidoglycan-binding domain
MNNHILRKQKNTMKQILVAIIIICGAFAATAQEKKDIFVVQLGNFSTTKLEDYKSVSQLGLVYAGETQDGQTPIYIGDFGTKDNAETVLAEAKKKGYSGASLSPRKSSGKQVSVIQLGGKKLGEVVQWSKYAKAGQIAILPDLANKGIKLLSVGFADDVAVKKALTNLKALGYKDAYIRNLDESAFHLATPFETNGVVFDATIPEIKIDPITPPAKKADSVAVQTNVPVVMPAASYKRQSVGELQKALSELGAYNGKIDGDNVYITKAAFDAAAKDNKVLQKYLALAKTAPIAAGAKTSELQFAVNSILSKPAEATKALEKSKQPIAKAYRAYLMFTQNGDAKKINNLMNEAIGETFNVKGAKNSFNFDTKSTYSYTTLAQLLQHLRYVQGADKNQLAFPSWMLEEHPKEAMAALEPKESFEGNYKVEVKDKFMEWEEILLLQKMADDLNTEVDKNADTKRNKEAQRRTQLYLLPKTIDMKDKDVYKGWNIAVWRGLNRWAEKDEVNKQTVMAFKAVYYKALLHLEDHYTSKGIKGDQATILAYYTLQTVIDRPLQRYIFSRN